MRQFPCFGAIINLALSLKRELKQDIFLEKNNHNFIPSNQNVCCHLWKQCYKEVILVMLIDMIGINGKFAKAFIIQQNHDLDESH